MMPFFFIYSSIYIKMSVSSQTPSNKPQTPKKLRHFKRIPIFIVENHNEVLEFIYRCLGARYLPFHGNQLIHFDSHPDMTVPRNLPAEHVHNKERLLDALSIENWIMPMAFAGHFTDLVWCKPPWAKQIPAGTNEFLIGDHCGLIRLSSTLEYFVSEGSYRPEQDLQRAQLIRLQTIEINDQSAWVTPRQQVDVTNYYVLDIDLDFFSTRNPFLGLYAEANVYEQLKKIFHYELEPSQEPQLVLECVRKRLEQLDELEKVFSFLNQNGKLSEWPQPRSAPIEAVWRELCAMHMSVQLAYDQHRRMGVDWQLIYDAGCTRDTTGLPHHESTDEEIDRLVDQFTQFLRGLDGEPTAVTMSRSTEDDYCPAHQVEQIQRKVLDALSRVYGDRLTDRPIRYYKEEEWSLEEL